jgi:hypothetical protein
LIYLYVQSLFLFIFSIGIYMSIKEELPEDITDFVSARKGRLIFIYWFITFLFLGFRFENENENSDYIGAPTQEVDMDHFKDYTN